MSIQTESKAEFLYGHCSRLMHGTCATRACLLRGGWKPGESQDKATCAPFEIWSDLTDLILATRLLRRAVTELNCHVMYDDEETMKFLREKEG